MQYRQPMHRCISIITIPSSFLFHVAETGQTLVQAGLEQWLQSTSTGCFFSVSEKCSWAWSGKAFPKSSVQIHLYFLSGLAVISGKLCSRRQAEMQASRTALLKHLSMSRTRPSCLEEGVLTGSFGTTFSEAKVRNRGKPALNPKTPITFKMLRLSSSNNLFPFARCGSSSKQD